MDGPNLPAWVSYGASWGVWLLYGGALYLWVWDHTFETWLRRTEAPPRPHAWVAYGLHPRATPYYRMIQGTLLVGTAVLGLRSLGRALPISVLGVLGALLFYVLPVLGAALGRWWGYRRAPWRGWLWRPALVVLSAETLLLEPFALVERSLEFRVAPTPPGTQVPTTPPTTEEVTFHPETVEDLLVPCTDVTAYSLDAPVEEMARVLLQTRLAWAVVYDVHPERWVGVVTWEHVIRGLLTDPRVPIRQTGWVEPLAVPEGQRLLTLWRQWATGYPPVAFVYDEYGEVLGLLRWTDLAASLAGQADKEAGAEDYARRFYETWSENEWVVRGRCPIELFWRVTGLDPDLLPRHLETVAGWVASMVPTLPNVGEVIRWNGLEFTVLEVKNRRLEKIRVVRRPSQSLDRPAPDATPPGER